MIRAMQFFAALTSIKAVLYDLDDTLILGPHLWGWRVAAWHMGLLLPDGWEGSQRGVTNETAVERLFPDQTVETKKRLAECKREVAERLAPFSRPMPGVWEAVEGLTARKCRYGIATSSPASFVDAVCAGGVLRGFKGKCVTPGLEYSASKPDPACLFALRKKLGLSSSDHTLYLGDSDSDRESAKRASDLGSPTTFVLFDSSGASTVEGLVITDHRQILDLIDTFSTGTGALRLR